MAEFEVDMSEVLEFSDSGSFYSWLEVHHDIDEEHVGQDTQGEVPIAHRQTGAGY